MNFAISFQVGRSCGWLRATVAVAVASAALAAGNLFAAPAVKTLGGGAGGVGYEPDPTETLYALFDNPLGIAVDQEGQNLYVADELNNAIRDVDLSAGVTYPFVTNQIRYPVGVAVDGQDNVYVLNRGGVGAICTNGTVLKFDDLGDLLAVEASNLTNAAGLALDTSGNIYVTERTNLVVRISSAIQTTIATVTMSNAMLEGVAMMPNGTLAVCDYGRDGIYTIDPNTGIVTTNAGFNGPGDGTGPNNRGVLNSSAKFLEPFGVAACGDGSVIVSDFGNDRVKVVTASGITTNLYGVSSNDWSSSFPGWADGTVVTPDAYGGVAARCPAGVALSPDGTTVYTTEDYYDLIREVTGSSFQPVPPAPPQAPTGVTAVVVTNGQGTVEVVVSWNPITVGAVTNYIVGRATSSGGPFPTDDLTAGTTFTDTNIVPGYTYYYVVQAGNAGGVGPASAPPVGVTIPIPPPPAPNIGWYDFEGNTLTGFYSTLHPVSPGNPYTANNPVLLAVDPATNGVSTYYITDPPYTNNAPASLVMNYGSTPPVYENNQAYGSPNVNPLPFPPLSNGVVTIEAVNVNSVGEASPVSSASFKFVVGGPTIGGPNGGNNAAQFTVSDITTNVVFYYTLDGSDPTNAPPSQQVYTTNGLMTLSLNGSTNIFFQVRAIGTGPDAGFLMSGIAQRVFSPNAWVPNTISWGFASGECSSAFIAAAGQTFFAPVTLTMLPNTTVYSMQFNMTVSTDGVGVTNPAPPPGPFGFQSMLMKPVPDTDPTLYTNIPPWVFAAEETSNLPPEDYITNGNGVFVNLVSSNGNELAVGWVERAGFTNLYNTKAQTLISYSLAHDDLFPNAAQGEPNGVIVGSYRFQVSPLAVNGQQYQIQIGRASATSDGVGAPGSGVDLFSPDYTNPPSLAAGSLNAIKNVTVGSIPYLVGNVYPFGWFNAGDFGNSNLQSADVQQVFNSAVYDLNVPPVDPTSWNGTGFTSVSDMYDAMDSCGDIGIFDADPNSQWYGYITNAGPPSPAVQTALYSGNASYINQLAFGDGKLDVCDVYLTFLRSEFTNSYVWYQRLWTNGVRVAISNWAPGVIPAVQMEGLSGGGQLKAGMATDSPISITNSPFVNFTATNIVASAGQTVTIPINATVFGPYPLRMLMLNVSVVPLDGSPALTDPIQFNPSSALASAVGSSTPMEWGSSGNGNYSAVWMPASMNVTDFPGFTNTANIGMLSVTIPTNAGSMSAYAIHFDHASASPSGLLSFPDRALTGLITLSSRTNSYYDDGIPDWWRLQYFGTIYNELSVSNADADGTGMNNWQKFKAGLDPLDPTSVLNEGIDQSMAQGPRDFVLDWPSVAGKTYVIERSPTLFPPQWTPISTNIGDGTYMEIHDVSSAGKGYYKVTTQ